MRRCLTPLLMVAAACGGRDTAESPRTGVQSSVAEAYVTTGDKVKGELLRPARGMPQ